MFSIIRTAVANGLEPYWYIRYLLDNLIKIKSKEDLEAFIPHNVTKDMLNAYKEEKLPYEKAIMAKI